MLPTMRTARSLAPSGLLLGPLALSRAGALAALLSLLSPALLRAQPAASGGAKADPATAPATPPPEPALSTPIPTPPLSHAAFGSPLAPNLSVDLPVVLSLGAVLLGTTLSDSQLPPPSCSPLCDPATVNGLDRVSIGWNSRPARTASDLFLGINLALPVVLDLIDVATSRPPDALRGYLGDVLILSEVFVVTAGLTSVLKYAVRRPRPFLYSGDMDAFPLEARQDVDAGLSFFSGHSSSAFAMATAGSYLYMLRHPQSKWVIPVWILSEALAATTAGLRVAAGKHFITDVLVGAAVGSAVGFLIPYLHRRALPRAIAQRTGRFGQDLRVSLAPMLAPDGGGLILGFTEAR
jgi:membrane-associated phospholipid phosphatase